MKKRKSKLETLTSKQIDEITAQSEKRKDVPIIKSSQVNMRVTSDLLTKIKKLAKAQGLPYTTFLTQLIAEDIERLWGVFKKH